MAHAPAQQNPDEGRTITLDEHDVLAFRAAAAYYENREHGDFAASPDYHENVEALNGIDEALIAARQIGRP